MNQSGNGNGLYSHGKKFPRMYASLRYSTVTDITFRKMTVGIFLSDFQSIATGVYIIILNLFFYFSTIDVQFCVELFLCCSTVDCLHLHFTVLQCVLGNESEMEIRLKLGNRKGQEWKRTAWERKEIGM